VTQRQPPTPRQKALAAVAAAAVVGLTAWVASAACDPHPMETVKLDGGSGTGRLSGSRCTLEADETPVVHMRCQTPQGQATYELTLRRRSQP